MLYILLVIGTMRRTWGVTHEEMVRRKWGLGEVVAPTIWDADWDYFSTADHCHHTLCPCPCCLQEASIVTELDLRFNNIIYHQYSSLTSLLNFWITPEPLRVYLRFRYYKQVSSSFCNNLSLIYKGSMLWRSLLRRSRKWLFLRSDT